MNQDISAFQDFREIAALPVAAALAALVVTWTIWYFTGNRCTEELAAATGCNASTAAAFINPALLKDILTNSAIAATGGGVWSYIMITRERRAREAAEQAKEAAERAQESAEQARQAAEQARQAAEQALAQERQKGEEERNRLLAEIERLTRQLDDRQDEPSEQTEC